MPPIPHPTSRSPRHDCDMCAHFMPPLGNRSIIASGCSCLLQPLGVLRWRKAFYKFHASDYASCQSLQSCRSSSRGDPWAAVTRSTKRNPICVINGMRLAQNLPLLVPPFRIYTLQDCRQNTQLCFKILRTFHALQDVSIQLGDCRPNWIIPRLQPSASSHHRFNRPKVWWVI